MRTIIFSKPNISTIPARPGIYIFKDINANIIYIGKAKNLRNRVKSYTAVSLAPKTGAMVAEASTLSFIETDSEFEALLLEAKLVRKEMPKYNSELKDDKSPLYIVITKDEYPKLLTIRQTDLPKYRKNKGLFGPYVDARSAKMVVKLLKRAFPLSSHRLGKRACLDSQIGLCNPCPNEIHNMRQSPKKRALWREYRQHARTVKSILSGNLVYVREYLVKKMTRLAKKEKYEQASKVRNQITALWYVSHATFRDSEYLSDPNLVSDIREEEISELRTIINEFIDTKRLTRIECFDVAHLSGSFPTASMVTFINGDSEKSFYRHFKIRKEKANSDTDSMREVLKRRSKYFDKWGKPDLIIVDGGKGQLSTAISVLGSEIPIVGLAKRYETLVFFKDEKFIERVVPRGHARNLVVRIRDEAHRFARTYHHKLVSHAILKV